MNNILKQYFEHEQNNNNNNNSIPAVYARDSNVLKTIEKK